MSATQRLRATQMLIFLGCLANILVVVGVALPRLWYAGAPWYSYLFPDALLIPAGVGLIALPRRPLGYSMRGYYRTLGAEALVLVPCLAFFLSANPLGYCYYFGPVELAAYLYLILLPLAVGAQVCAMLALSKAPWRSKRKGVVPGLLLVAIVVAFFAAPRDPASSGWQWNIYPGCPPVYIL